MRINENTRRVIDSPITQSRQWAASWRGPAPLIDVSQAAPGYPPAEALRAHVAEIAHDPATATYTDQMGIAPLRKALAGRISEEYGASVSPAQVAITAGCNQAFCMVMMAIAEPDDEVLLPIPYYFNHDMWLRALGMRPVYVPCDRQMRPDPRAVAGLVGERTRALVLVTPNNPSGAIYPSAAIDELYQIAREHGLALVVDETYRDFRGTARVENDGEPPHALLRRPDWAATLIQLYSFSKAYCLTGYRVGAITANEELLRQVAKLVDCVTICPSHLSQRAALFALRDLDAWRDEKALEIARRMEVFREASAAARCPFRTVSAGAYFAYVEHPFSDRSSTEVARRLASAHGVLALPGEMFGPEQERYLRLAFANLSQEGIRALVERLCAAGASPC